MKRIYMDYAATTPVDQRVVEAMAPYWNQFYGNPSSLHSFGQETLEAIENARNEVSSLLGANPKEIIFTSGGSESDNTAIKGIGYALREKGNHLITTEFEHHAVSHTCAFMADQGFHITYLKVDRNGILDPDDVKKAITDKTILISVMHGNNEVGTLQPLQAIGDIARERGILFHTDAVQSFGHIPIDVAKMNIDLLSLSAHKLYGPKGVGALYIRQGTPFIPFMHGGAQEGGRRSSTHNVTGIVGLGMAAQVAAREMAAEHKRILKQRDHLLDKIFQNITDVHLNGDRHERLANNINISIAHVEGESMLMNLDMEGIAVSSGSACSSGSDEPSHVLMALGLSPEMARGSLRITLGRFTTDEEIDRVADSLKQVVSHLRSLSSFGEER